MTLDNDTLVRLQREMAAARKMGIPDVRLPVVHGQLSPADATAAAQKINIAMGRPPSFDFLHNQQAAPPVKAPGVATPAQSPAPQATPVAMHQQNGFGPSLLGTAPAAPPPVAAGPESSADPMAALTAQMQRGGKLAPGQTAIRTSGGMQAPAVRPDGSQMSNTDGTPRFASFQPSATEALVGKFGDAWTGAAPSARADMLRTLPHDNSGGVVTDPGATAPNARGESTVQTPRGTEIAVDPMKDLSKTWLPKGNPLVGGADRGVVIDQRYRTPGASPIGTGTGGNSFSDFAPQPTNTPKAPNPINPAATIAMTGQAPEPAAKVRYEIPPPEPAAKVRFEVPPPTPPAPSAAPVAPYRPFNSMGAPQLPKAQFNSFGALTLPQFQGGAASPPAAPAAPTPSGTPAAMVRSEVPPAPPITFPGNAVPQRFGDLSAYLPGADPFPEEQKRRRDSPAFAGF